MRYKRPFQPKETLLAAADLLCNRGLNVLPLTWDKNLPAKPWRAMQTERQIERDSDEIDKYLLHWWGSGSDSGVGVVTGEINGIVVFDADDDAGLELLKRGCGGALPRTPIVKTRRGHHVWFAHPGSGCPNRVHLGEVGLDVRGDGGYVSVPPTGSKTWVLSPEEAWPPVPIPLALALLAWPPIPEPPKPTANGILSRGSGRGYARAALDYEVDTVRHTPVGERNHQLYKSTYSLSRFIERGQLTPEEIERELAHAAESNGLPSLEVRRTVASALQARGG